MREPEGNCGAAQSEHSQFEALLADLSSKFAQLPAGEVDHEIEAAQRRICGCLGFDRSTLWQQPAEQPEACLLTHAWQPPDAPPLPMRTDAAAMCPWLLRQVLGGKTVALSRLQDFPPEAAGDRECLRGHGTKSTIVLPLSAGGAVIGALSFATFHEERECPEPLVKRLQLVAQIFANALARKRANEAFRESEERLRLAAQAAQFGMFDVDLVTGVGYWSPELRAIVGLSGDAPPQLGGVPEFIHPDDVDQVREAMRRAFDPTGDGAVVDTHRIARPDGAVRWIQQHAQVRFAEQGSRRRPIRASGIILDVTEQKLAEEALRQSEERFRQIAELTNDFIWEVDAEGLYTYTSPSVQKILGYAPEELVGKFHFYDFFAPHVQADLRAAASEVFAARRAFRAFCNLNVGKDGRVVHLETSGVPLLDDAGNLLGYRGADTDVTERKRAEEQLGQTLDELRRLRDQLHQQNVYLQQELKLLTGQTRLVGQSQALRSVLAQVEQVAPTDATVLLLGETGTGKELIAAAVHDLSPRRSHVMVRVNCSAIPAPLIESELFGREKGAYTGALSKQMGRFEMANGSTLFLDEIGELPLEVQVKLLRVLEERRIERLGSPRPIPVDVRIITATNQELEKAIREGRFRQDLYYRLNVFPVRVPPLREHREDIPLLVNAFVREFGAAFGKHIESVARESMDALQRYHWPGNVRELRNLVQRSVILAKGPSLRIEVPGTEAAAPAATLALKDAEREHIIRVLELTGWRIRGTKGAAELLGMKPTTLESRMCRLEIRRHTDEAPK